MDGHIGAGADGEPDVRACEGRGVVDAVAHHRDRVALRLQFHDFIGLALRTHAGDNAPDVDLVGDGTRRRRVVARQHDRHDAALGKQRDGPPRIILRHVGDRHDAGKRAVDGDQHRGFPLGRQAFHIRDDRVEVLLRGVRGGERHADVEGVDQVGVADGGGVRQPAEDDVGGDALPGNRTERSSLPWCGRVLLRRGHDRGGERMFGVAFGRGCDRQQVVRGVTPGAERQHVGQRGPSGGDGASFVKYDGIDFSAGFQCFRGADEHAHACGAAGGDRDGQGCCETERAWAGDEQHRYRGHQRVRDAWLRAERVPHRAGPDRDQHDDGHEDAGDPVREPLHRRFRALRGLDHADDLREHGVLADFRGPVA